MPETATKEITRLKAIYLETVFPKLQEQFKYENIHQVPKLAKIVINRGVGEASANAKALDASFKEIAQITGQQPVITRAKKAIASFKVRAGMPVGIMVTLRSDRMYEFMDRLVSIALPRIRDFRGVNPKSFDGRGNYSLGLREQLLFPEISYESVDKVRGMDIIICTTARTDEEGRALLAELGMPFRKT
ncbi:50S ribosomal protein L5 [Anthocerotibacter panamensis]|uniref:50S ribosomal protein L5 n=1 Tax=Anthocerotibacter panamensis TaxID=2857077 RepID=UPI001FD893EA|nr:50S ribosomal protein L5 [Anthocerotibacter panamensis]